MWDVMRSPFQSKHINDSMFIESRYWQFLVLFLLLLLKISFVIRKVLYFILQVTVKYNFTIHCNMWNLKLLKTFCRKSVNHLRSPPDRTYRKSYVTITNKKNRSKWANKGNRFVLISTFWLKRFSNIH